MDESHLPSRLQQILDQLASYGYIGARELDASASEKLAVALARCVAALGPKIDVVSIETLPHQVILKRIEEALRSMECPYSLESSESMFPVAQWLLDRVRTSQSDRDDEDQRKVVALNQLQRLRERVRDEGVETKMKMLVSVMQSLKDLERQESEFQSYSEKSLSQLEDEVIDLKEKSASAGDSERISEGLNHTLGESRKELAGESRKELDSAKKDLAATLRALLSVKHQLDDVPCQSEVVQYERRFSELYSHIQGKHQQTQKYYDTYNALLEIKQLMQKETSLLNSISSQFQGAITSIAGRSKLIESMEGIVKSSQQKLEKVQLRLEEQQKVSDALKEKYTAAIATQRHWNSLLKAFQEEYAKNETLRSSSSVSV